MSDVPADKINILLAVKSAQRPQRRAAFSLALPLFLFLLLVFVAPIAVLLATAISNSEPKAVLPKTMLALEQWDGSATPDETVFAALADDLKAAQENRTAALLGKRLNYEIPGMRSRVVKTARMLAAMPEGPYKDKVIEQDKEWASTAIWATIKRNRFPVTAYYLLTALDITQTESGGLSPVLSDEAIFMSILGRTLFIAFSVTVATLILGYPVAYVLTIASPRVGQVMMLMVLLPLWTSLLVRTTAWVVLLQTDGIINDSLMAIGLTSQKLQLIFTRFGTVTAMTHIQLPFTILPIYSVMRAIPATQLRAARSLGAGPLSAFWRIYAPQTIPGVVAGCLMTFILSLGYYITPALVGGPSDQMISNFISVFIDRDLNWGQASALGIVLLVVTLGIYGIFLKLVSVDKLKLG